MPWLDHLAEDDGQVLGPAGVLADEGRDDVVYGAEELAGKGTAVVEVELESVRGVGNRGGCGGRAVEFELVPGKLGRESHVELWLMVCMYEGWLFE